MACHAGLPYSAAPAVGIGSDGLAIIPGAKAPAISERTDLQATFLEVAANIDVVNP